MRDNDHYDEWTEWVKYSKRSRSCLLEDEYVDSSIEEHMYLAAIESKRISLSFARSHKRSSVDIERSRMAVVDKSKCYQEMVAELSNQCRESKSGEITKSPECTKTIRRERRLFGKWK